VGDVLAVLGLLAGGLLLGGLARLLVPGRQSFGCFTTMTVGVVGLLAGTYLGREVFHLSAVISLLLAVPVAVVLVLIAEAIWRFGTRTG